MVEELTAEELWEKLRTGEEVQVVDIRAEAAFERGHIPGAVNVPFDRFAAEVGHHEWGEQVVLACPEGESSLQAARLLESYEAVGEDTTVANLEGGYRAWEYELDPGSGNDG